MTARRRPVDLESAPTLSYPIHNKRPSSANGVRFEGGMTTLAMVDQTGKIRSQANSNHQLLPTQQHAAFLTRGSLMRVTADGPFIRASRDFPTLFTYTKAMCKGSFEYLFLHTPA